MSDIRAVGGLKTSKTLENLARALAVCSFVLMCWVTKRTLQVRTNCVNSSFLSFVQIGDSRIQNCLFESRLNLNELLHPFPAETLEMVRSLEVLEPLVGLFPALHPRLAVEISLTESHLFELGRGYVRLGREWLSDPLQTQRALIMGLLKREQPHNYTSPFQLEVMTDFLLITVMAQRQWDKHSIAEDIKFPTSSPSFEDYCKSPFRSLAHYDSCLLPVPDSVDLQANVWGFRPLLAVAMSRMFEKASIHEKYRALQAIRFGEPAPVIGSLHETSLDGRVEWFRKNLEEQTHALHFGGRDPEQWALKRTLKELDVEAPTHWEMTVDITNTPAWKEILTQFKTWSTLHRRDRILVFTPEGAVALPSGLPVAWTRAEIQSQKHVLIACHWPKPADVVAVSARHLFAKQSCAKVDEVFWN